MCVYEMLTKRNIMYFQILNSLRLSFNKHNEDFFYFYNAKNIIGKMQLRKSVYMLKKNNKYIGYIWSTREGNSLYYINSMNLIPEECSASNIMRLLGIFRPKDRAYLMCSNNGYNIKLLEEVGFKKKNGTLKMERDLMFDRKSFLPKEVQFKMFQRGKDEEIRCFIQNEVFKNQSRKPLTIKDIVYDQYQEYYFPEGAIFIIVNGVYIGYGQIIIYNSTPLIVNVGILKEYRGKGYGEILINYLLNIIIDYEFKKAIIKVDWNNETALNLYKKCGFRVIEEDYKMEITI